MKVVTEPRTRRSGDARGACGVRARRERKNSPAAWRRAQGPTTRCPVARKRRRHAGPREAGLPEGSSGPEGLEAHARPARRRRDLRGGLRGLEGPLQGLRTSERDSRGACERPLFFRRDYHSPTTTAIRKRPVNVRRRILGHIARVTSASPDAF